MKKYNSVFELEAELITQGFIKDRDITIPADVDPEAGCLHDKDGHTLYSYPMFKAFYITLKK